MYGGAHLFRADIAAKLGAKALAALDAHAADDAAFARAFELPPGIAADVHARVRAKLAREPVEDYRIDFEDGYGVRSDEDEDAHADAAGRALTGAESLPRIIGIRLKASPERARRTLDKLIMAARGKLPPAFVATLPKVRTPDEVAAFAKMIPAEIAIEIMVEDPLLLPVLREAVAAAGPGRCVAAHFGAYDYTAACGVAAPHQTLDHPACDFVRQAMHVALAGTGTWLVDGATTEMPVGETPVVHAAWRTHARNVRRAAAQGFWQGWDLHPAQLVARWAALFATFREALPAMQARLRAFVANESQATRVGAVFDDAATGRGLRAFFDRGVACGALDASEAP